MDLRTQFQQIPKWRLGLYAVVAVGGLVGLFLLG